MRTGEAEEVEEGPEEEGCRVSGVEGKLCFLIE